MVSVPHSCPTFGLIPPRPPARKPLQPVVEPPDLLLPSSPMFETELSRQSQRGAGDSQHDELSRSLTNYSGFSCPGIPSGFLMQQRHNSGSNTSSNIRGGGGNSVPGSEVKLSSSPTVFELLKRRTSSNVSATAASGRLPAPNFGEGQAGLDFGAPSDRPEHSRLPEEDLSDMLQFDLTLDGNDTKTGGDLHPSLT